jgi:ribA/ribD-fused uncharacterized protein
MTDIWFNSGTAGYEWLSNFAPADIEWRNMQWKTVEHAYQAAKSTDPYDWIRIQSAPTARAAKQMGKHVELRSDWHSVKDCVMFELLQLKFTRADMRDLLLGTGTNRLIHLSPWDKYWGAAYDGTGGMDGANVLGHMLEVVRAKLRN